MSKNCCCYHYTTAAIVDYYYTLRDVIFYLENTDASVAEYRRKVVTMRCTAVVELDKASLKGYVTGAIDSCPQLDFAAAVASAASYNANLTQEVEQIAAPVPLISAQEMQEQRQRHAAIFDQSVQTQTQTVRCVHYVAVQNTVADTLFNPGIGVAF